MKKNYLKPDAEYISFYSEEEIADVVGNGSTTGDITEGEGGWGE